MNMFTHVHFARRDCSFCSARYTDADETALGLLVVELENQHGSSDWKIETFEKDRLVAVMARDDKTASKEKCSIIYGPPMRENETYTLRINPCT